MKYLLLLLMLMLLLTSCSVLNTGFMKQFEIGTTIDGYQIHRYDPLVLGSKVSFRVTDPITLYDITNNKVYKLIQDSKQVIFSGGYLFTYENGALYYFKL